MEETRDQATAEALLRKTWKKTYDYELKLDIQRYLARPAAPAAPSDAAPLNAVGLQEAKVGFDSILYWLDAEREVTNTGDSHQRSEIRRIALHFRDSIDLAQRLAAPAQTGLREALIRIESVASNEWERHGTQLSLEIRNEARAALADEHGAAGEANDA